VIFNLVFHFFNKLGLRSTSLY